MYIGINSYTYPPKESIESVSALVVLGIVPDDSDCGEQTRKKGRNGGWLRFLELFTRTLEEGDELETVLCTELALLQGRGGREGEERWRESQEERGGRKNGEEFT